MQGSFALFETKKPRGVWHGAGQDGESRMKKGVWMRGMGISLALLLLTGCAPQEEERKEVETQAEKTEAVSYEMTPVTRGTVAQPLTLKCEYSQTQQVDVYFDIDKELITEVYVEPGDTVRAGDLLAEVDVEEMEARVRELTHQIEMNQLKVSQLEERRNFELEQADILYTYTRMEEADEKALKEQKDSIEETYGEQISDLQDELYLEGARTIWYQERIDKGRLYAPMSGVLSFVKSDLVNTYTDREVRVCSIYDDSTFLFHSENLEAAPYLDTNQVYTIVCGLGNMMREYPVRPVMKDGWREHIYFELVDAQLEFPNITTGTVTLYVQEKENVLCVDADAVHTSGEQYYVYRLDENQVRYMQFVELGLWGEDLVEVVSGLSEGDYVILR